MMHYRLKFINLGMSEKIDNNYEFRLFLFVRNTNKSSHLTNNFFNVFILKNNRQSILIQSYSAHTKTE